MTLKQAYKIWANMPGNIVLATKSHTAVQRVLMKKWNDIDLEQITPTFARKIFTQSSELQEMKAKAASILVHVMNWGAEKGHCKRPNFDYSIANNEETKKKRNTVPTIYESPASPVTDEGPLVRVKPEALAKREEELAARNKPKKEMAMEQKKTMRGKAIAHSFAQIDPESLEVIKVWPSKSQAENELRARNIDRAAKTLGKAAGYYWSDAKEVDTFKERLKAKKHAKSTAKKSAGKPAPNREKTVAQLLRETPDKAPSINEHDISNAARDALEVFTDDELLAELDRRGWQGEIRKIQIVSIGVK